ncbi:hypothetical protein GQR36_25220 [Enterococcus termitis]
MLAFEHQISGDGTFGSTPSVQFIAPPLNTEARESWSNRIRKEIYSTLNMPDFEQVMGTCQPTQSEFTCMKLFSWQRAWQMM